MPYNGKRRSKDKYGRQKRWLLGNNGQNGRKGGGREEL